jgi:UPF0176 protein
MCIADGRLLLDCIDVIHLPEEERKATRKGIKNGNKIFKRKIRRIDFRNRATYYDPLAAVPNQ